MTQSYKINHALDRLALSQMSPGIDKYLDDDGETTVSGRNTTLAIREGGKPKPDPWPAVVLIIFMILLGVAGFVAWYSLTHHPAQPAATAPETLQPGSLKAGITSTNPFANQGP